MWPQFFLEQILMYYFGCKYTGASHPGLDIFYGDFFFRFVATPIHLLRIRYLIGCIVGHTDRHGAGKYHDSRQIGLSRDCERDTEFSSDIAF